MRPKESCWSFWYHWRDVYKRQGVQYARMYLQGSQLMTASVTDIKFYEAYPLASSMAEMDVRALNWGKMCIRDSTESSLKCRASLLSSIWNTPAETWSSSEKA